MTNTAQYKGYVGSIEIDLDAGYLHGKILHVQDLVTFTTPDVAGLNKAFQEAVDDYLELCKTVGKSPDRPFSGTFQVRMSSDQHRALCMEASARGLTLNELSVEKLTMAPSGPMSPQVVIKTLNVNVQSSNAPEIIQPPADAPRPLLKRVH